MVLFCFVTKSQNDVGWHCEYSGVLGPYWKSQNLSSKVLRVQPSVDKFTMKWLQPGLSWNSINWFYLSYCNCFEIHSVMC
jgi:hypothetical protein